MSRMARWLRMATCVSVTLTCALAVPSAASAWQIWVTPQVIHRPGTVTIHKSTAQSCPVVVEQRRGAFHRHIRRSLRIRVPGGAPLGRTKVTVTCGSYYATTYFTVKRRAPARTPTKPTPGPTANLPPVTPWTIATTPVADNTEGIIPGGETCFSGSIWRADPTISAPTGLWVYAREALFTKPADGSGNWALASYGPLYYQGTNRGVFLWYDINNNNVAPQSDLDSFNVTPGYQADVLQYVWDNGVWYESDAGACTP